MQVRRLTSLDELIPLRHQWNDLAGGVPFRSWAWVESWWRAYGETHQHSSRQRELCVLMVRDTSGRLVGLAPWYLERSRSRGAVIRFLGSGEVCSDYLSMLCVPGLEDPLAQALTAWLWYGDSADDNLDWDLIDFGPIHEHDTVTNRLAQQIQLHGATVHQRPSVNCWRLALPNSWEEYLARLSKSHRKQIRQLERRYFDSGVATLRVAQSPAQLEEGLAIFRHLHQKRRRALGERGCFESQCFSSFIDRVSPQLLAAGSLRLAWVEMDGRPAAIEYQLLGSDTVFAYQAGVDPAALEHEPGRLITIATLKQAIAEGRKAMDLLRGDEPYKAHWRAEPNATSELRIVATSGSAQLRHRAWLAGVSVKRLVRGA